MIKAIKWSTGAERFRFEPTVFGAVRRYYVIVAVCALLGAALGLGYALMDTKLYRADASVTVPKLASLKDQDPDQYFDSQVLLLKSPEVAQQAVRTANAALGADVVSERDFVGDDKSLEILPPEGANPGSYGANTVKIAFTWPDPRVAQVGANAVLQAFDVQRSVTIRAQAEATVAGIEKAMVDTRARDQLADLVNQRSDTLVTEQVDLASHPTFASATVPEVPINGSKRNAGALGLLIGAIVGSALAFLRASLHVSFDDKLDPADLYQAPLLGEISVARTDHGRFHDSAAPGVLPMTVPRRPSAEEFRFAAVAIEKIRAARRPVPSLAFVSPLASVSRSAATANIALAMAEGGMRVLAVDADPVGRLSALLLEGGPAADGFAQVVGQELSRSAYLRPSSWNSSVSVLPFGTPTSEPVRGPSYAKAVADLLERTRADHDVVLVDSPPLLEVAEATELVRTCDAVVVVVDHHEPVEHHADVVRRLDLLEADVVGYLYNRSPRSHPSWRGRSTPTARRPASAAPAKTVPVMVAADPGGANGAAGTANERQAPDFEGATRPVNGHQQSSA